MSRDLSVESDTKQSTKTSNNEGVKDDGVEADDIEGNTANAEPPLLLYERIAQSILRKCEHLLSSESSRARMLGKLIRIYILLHSLPLLHYVRGRSSLYRPT